MPDETRIAIFGGIYSNHFALASALADAKQRGVDAIYCLGDMGAFGPHPDRTLSLLREHDVICIQGNYDNSIGNELADCQCGYTDPRDNHFARLSYEYTLRNTSPDNRAWLATLPVQRRVQLRHHRLLLCHGSPRRTNEFLWESTTSTQFLEHLVEAHDADVILATHTGIKWQRVMSGDRHFVNVGVLGRPENDGYTNVWYAILEAQPAKKGSGPICAQHPPGRSGKWGLTHFLPTLRVEFVPVVYDHEQLAAEMRQEKLPEEFVETVMTGWWTTCLEVLPAKERRRGRW